MDLKGHVDIGNLSHKGGTKFYRVMTITTTVEGQARGVLMQRWGKNGSFGQTKFTTWSDMKKMEDEVEKVFHSKMKRGYAADKNSFDTKEFNTDGELRAILGPAVWAKIPAFAMIHIDPIADVSTRRKDNDLPQYEDENGNQVGSQSRTISKRELAQMEAEQRATEAEESKKALSNLTNFGMF